MIPYYGAYANKADQYFVTGSVVGIGLIYKQLIAMCIALFYPKISNKFYATLFLSGCVLDNIFLGTFIFERISNYLVYTNINYKKPYSLRTNTLEKIRKYHNISIHQIIRYTLKNEST